MKAFLAVLLLMTVSGAGLVLAGIHLLVGVAWTMIAAGLALVAAAIFLRRGLLTNVR